MYMPRFNADVPTQKPEARCKPHHQPHRTLSHGGVSLRCGWATTEQWSRTIVRGQYIVLLDLHRQHECFAAEWDRNLTLQGFAEAFTDAAICS